MNQGLLGWPTDRLRRGPYQDVQNQLGWPVGGVREPLWESVGVVTAGNTQPTQVAAPAGANTKGSWVQLAAATARDAFCLYLNTQDGGDTGRDSLYDIGFGSSGGEVAVIENLMHTFQGTFVAGFSTPHLLPLFIPAGSRVAARHACSTGSTNLGMSAMLCNQPMPGWPRRPLYQAMGHDAADSGGTSIEPGGSANTKGSWVQLGFTDFRTRFLQVMIGSQRNGTMQTANWAVDIGYGPPSGPITTVIENYLIGSISNWDNIFPRSSPTFHCYIPAGSRIVARAQSTTTDATDRLFDVVLQLIG